MSFNAIRNFFVDQVLPDENQILRGIDGHLTRERFPVEIAKLAIDFGKPTDRVIKSPFTKIKDFISTHREATEIAVYLITIATLGRVMCSEWYRPYLMALFGHPIRS